MSALIRTPADLEALKRDAWAGYIADYTLAIDPDPAEARARYRKRMEAIEQIERNMEASDGPA